MQRVMDRSRFRAVCTRTAVVCACVLAHAVALGAAGLPVPLDDGRPAVGVLVPLSGRLESVGQRIVRGVMCACGVFGGAPGENVRFVVKDYGDSDASVGDMVDELARDEGVVAVIGPVGERARQVACARAALHGLPLVSFTQVEPEPRPGTTCFVNFLTFDMQARSLLGAARSLGVTRFAVLGADDQFGRAFVEAFARHAPSYGVKVTATRVYQAGRPDYLAELRALFSLASRSGDPDALLIADDAANAGMAASYLRLLKIRRVRLFGPALWDSPDLVRAGGGSVEGAVFLSGFSPRGVAAAPRGFAEAFRPYGAQPGIWEASAYDTARIVLGYLGAAVRPTRQGLTTYLAGLRGYDGASGVTSMRPDGSLEKKPSVLTVQGGEVVEIFP